MGPHCCGSEALMNSYLEATSTAATGLIDILNRERLRLSHELQTQQRMRVEAERLFNLGKSHGFTAELIIDIDGFERAAARYATDAEATQELLANLTSTYAVIAGAILQIAKQGLSLSHGPLGNCPAGRGIGSQTLSTVIWQGRNQAMHY